MNSRPFLLLEHERPGLRFENGHFALALLMAGNHAAPTAA
jgi:hypothetical protein